MLLVEDDAILAMSQKQQLESKGYDTHFVFNGEEAVETALNSDLSFDLILMDIDLGSGIDGASAAEEILEHLDIPLIFLSSHTEPEIVEKIGRISSYGYIGKSTGIDVIDTVIKMALKLFDANMQVKRELEIHKQTEQRLKLSEKALLESENLYRSLYKNTPVMQHSIDAEGRILSVSNKWLQEMGYSEDEVIGMKSIDFLTEESKKNESDFFFPELYKKGHCQDIPYQFVKKSGEIFDVLLSAISDTDNFGNIIRFLAVLIDVTDQKKAETEIVEIKQFYEEIVEGVQDGIWVTDEDNIICFANSGIEKIAGIHREQILGNNVLKDFDEETTGGIIDYYIQARKQKQAVWYDIKVKTPGGRYTWQNGWLIPKYKDNKFKGIICTIRDITEKRLSEIAIKNNEALLIEMGNIALIGGWEMDLIKRTSKWTKGTYDIVEIDYDDPVPGPDEHLEYYFPEYREMIAQKIKNLIENGEELEFEAKCRTGKENIKWCRGHGRRIMTNGLCLKIQGTLQDITSFKKVEQAELESRERFDLAMKASRDGLFDYNLETNEVYYSPGWASMLGYSTEELTNDLDFWEKNIDPDDLKRSWILQKELINGHRKRFEIEFKMKHKDGHWVDILSRAEGIFNENGKAVRMIGTHVDISEIKKYEKELKTSHSHLRTLSHHLQNAQEEQNAYIAREIHDDLGQELTALEMILTLFEEELARQRISDVKITDYKNELRTQLDSVVEKSRRLTQNLRPAVLDTYELIGALKWLSEEFRKHSKIDVHLNFLISDIDLGEEVNLSVYRIVQEAFNNITKHSQAEEVLIEVSEDTKTLNIRIKDDGIGFDKNEAHNMERSGLINMQERAVYCGGKTEVLSKPGEGTLIEIMIPYEDKI